MNFKFFNITIGAIYLYAFTILSQAGYDAYFGIPPHYLSYSIRENTIFLYGLVQGFWVSFLVSWYWYSIFIIAIALLWFYKKKYLFITSIILLVIFLYSAFDIGIHAGENRKVFLKFLPDCEYSQNVGKHIIPDLYDGKALVVPVDENNKMRGGFELKDFSDGECRVMIDLNFGEVNQ
jgi:hypothetical protein